MMPPQNRPPVLPMQTTPATPEPVFPAPARVDDILPVHADYDLHPLVVHSLDHYVIVDDEVKRFYVH